MTTSPLVVGDELSLAEGCTLLVPSEEINGLRGSCDGLVGEGGGMKGCDWAFAAEVNTGFRCIVSREALPSCLSSARAFSAKAISSVTSR